MATLTVTQISESAQKITPANADTSNGDLVPNANGDVMLLLENPGGSEATVTIAAQETSTTKQKYGDLTKADEVVTLAAGESWWVGPFPTKAFNNSSDQLELAYGGAGAADVDVTAFRGKDLRLFS